MTPGPDPIPIVALGARQPKDQPCYLKRMRHKHAHAPQNNDKTNWSWFRFLIFTGPLVAIVLFGHTLFVGPLSGHDLHTSLGGPLVLAIVAGWLLASNTVKQLFRKIQRNTIWWSIVVCLGAGLALRTEIHHLMDHVMASLIPRFGYDEQSASTTLYRATNGHFYMEALINKQPVSFLIDTASSGIVLPPRTARKLGFRPENLNFDQTLPTTRGNLQVATVVLEEFRLGDLHMKGVTANINGAPMRTALLGIQFFNQMLSWEVKGDRMTLRWRSKKGSPVDPGPKQDGSKS
ncbi:MAG: TIGR02281 family clan AA aspartic protease [Magnetococcales bacterium]|nr:TIGR02281 family clan AA aspartic protease [Magnetococcales bacterium]MBF0321627.1 TIGR02281 family clan AA aspartic protease [Magnetococcales bacterium]